MAERTSYALTVGEIAKRIGCPIHRIEYLIRARNIRPVQRAGNARVFTDVDLDLIAREIGRIDERGRDDS